MWWYRIDIGLSWALIFKAEISLQHQSENKIGTALFYTPQLMTHVEIVVRLTLSCWLVPWISSFPKFQIITNFKNTVHGFKKFHGRAFDDPFVHAEKPKLPYSLHKLANGNTGIKVRLLFSSTHRLARRRRLPQLGASSQPASPCAGLTLCCSLAGALLGWGQSVHHWADHRDAAQQAEGDGWGRSEEAGGGLCHLCERDKKKQNTQSCGLSSSEPFSAKLFCLSTGSWLFHRCRETFSVWCLSDCRVELFAINQWYDCRSDFTLSVLVCHNTLDSSVKLDRTINEVDTAFWKNDEY